MRLLSTFAGAASFGALLGVMIGLSASPVVAGAVTAAFALVGGIFSLGRNMSGTGERLDATIKPLQEPHAGLAVASFSIACTAALLLGVLGRTHHWLEPTLTAKRSELIALGVSEKKANQLLLAQALASSNPSQDTVKASSGALWSKGADDACEELTRARYTRDELIKRLQADDDEHFRELGTLIASKQEEPSQVQLGDYLRIACLFSPGR